MLISEKVNINVIDPNDNIKTKKYINKFSVLIDQCLLNNCHCELCDYNINDLPFISYNYSSFTKLFDVSWFIEINENFGLYILNVQDKKDLQSKKICELHIMSSEVVEDDYSSYRNNKVDYFIDTNYSILVNSEIEKITSYLKEVSSRTLVDSKIKILLNEFMKK